MAAANSAEAVRLALRQRLQERCAFTPSPAKRSDSFDEPSLSHSCGRLQHPQQPPFAGSCPAPDQHPNRQAFDFGGNATPIEVVEPEGEEEDEAESAVQRGGRAFAWEDGPIAGEQFAQLASRRDAEEDEERQSPVLTPVQDFDEAFGVGAPSPVPTVVAGVGDAPAVEAGDSSQAPAATAPPALQPPMEEGLRRGESFATSLSDPEQNPLPESAAESPAATEPPAEVELPADKVANHADQSGGPSSALGKDPSTLPSEGTEPGGHNSQLKDADVADAAASSPDLPQSQVPALHQQDSRQKKRSTCPTDGAAPKKARPGPKAAAAENSKPTATAKPTAAPAKANAVAKGQGTANSKAAAAKTAANGKAAAAKPAAIAKGKAMAKPPAPKGAAPKVPAAKRPAAAKAAALEPLAAMNIEPVPALDPHAPHAGGAHAGGAQAQFVELKEEAKNGRKRIETLFQVRFAIVQNFQRGNFFATIMRLKGEGVEGRQVLSISKKAVEAAAHLEGDYMSVASRILQRAVERAEAEMCFFAVCVLGWPVRHG